MRSLDARILSLLRSAPVHLPGEDLASETGSTLKLIGSRIEELRAAGYDIERRPHLGYRLVTAPDRLIADDLVATLAGRRLTREILVFEKTGSTNDVASRLGSAGAAEGLVVFAEQQSAGRGRLGRRWQSASHKGLWFSILLRPKLPLHDWTRLTTWAAVAVARGIEEVVNCRALIKWPNDIYFDGKKAVGILTESFVDRAKKNFAVVGIGLNVNQESFPPSLAAASLRMIAGRAVDRHAVAVAVLRRLDDSYAAMETGFPAIVAEANERSYLHGRRITARVGKAILAGAADRLDKNGGLVLRTDDGEEITISGGEVTVQTARQQAAF